jgi:ATP sulfurylase/adenylyl-sulfate kinase
MSSIGFTIWFTGLSGAGKTTLSEMLKQRLTILGYKVEILDGDAVRTHLSKGLGFSREDRDTHIKRIAFVSNLLTRNGVVCIAAAISPYREAREWARKEIASFVEVYLKCPIEVCRQRDIKGLYKLADEGKIKNFTGVSDPYEEPEHPELIIETDKETVEESVAHVFAKLEELGYLERKEIYQEDVQAATDHPTHLEYLQSKPKLKEVGVHTVKRLIAPHGGELVLNMGSESESAVLQECARSLPLIQVSSRQLADLEMLANGAYSPLSGFMHQADYLSVVNEMHLSNGLPWTVPIVLAVCSEQAALLKEGSQVALVDAEGVLQAVMTVDEKFSYDKQLEAREVYRTTDEVHPGVKVLYQQGDVLLGGPVRVVALQNQAFAQYRYTPVQSRQLFAERGWKQVVGFQTRNPVHRAHEYIQKCALEIVDGLYLHPLVGDTKQDDIPVDVRIHCYEALLEHYYSARRVILGVLPAAMRYAGPREAIFHALIRKNYGCSHFIVGRDHAGVGDYYGTYDAHYIFGEFEPKKLGIAPMFFDHTFFCHACDSMASAKTCPHGTDQHMMLSGTKVRQLLRAGEMLPREFSRPEVAKVLIEAMS